MITLNEFLVAPNHLNVLTRAEHRRSSVGAVKYYRPSKFHNQLVIIFCSHHSILYVVYCMFFIFLAVCGDSVGLPAGGSAGATIGTTPSGR